MRPPSPMFRPAMNALASFVALGLVCVVVYAALFGIDFGGTPVRTPLDILTVAGSADAIGSFAEVALAVVGVVITVVAIIVELAATRYTPRITELFVRDTINRGVMRLVVVTAVIVVWVSLSVSAPAHPQTMAVVATAMISASLLMVLPYFTYVFEFLTPHRVVRTIEARALTALSTMSRRPNADVGPARRDFTEAVEQLGDIALNSVQQKDKGIGIEAVEALADLQVHLLRGKKGLPAHWFATASLVGQDPDFVAFHPDILASLESRRVWSETKILRQFQGVFGDSLHGMRDIAHLVAIRTRQAAWVAIEQGDKEALHTTVRFLNTYLRASINGKDVRTAYNLLNEYRVLTERLLMGGHEQEALSVAGYMKFYGQLAFNQNIAFILESSAYDLGAVLEVAHARKLPVHDALLALFLELDREPEGGKGQESALRGVRKAQIKLATWYLAQGEEGPARKIFDDMRQERPARMAGIRAELEGITEAEYWEVSDRGINFEYIPEDRRAFLRQFFQWFEAQA